MQINGFDESGAIGKNIYFVRVGCEKFEILRPYIYNLMHFGDIIATKNIIKGVSKNTKKVYLREIREDPNFEIDYYLLNPFVQLDLLKTFIMAELITVSSRRQDLIRFYKNLDQYYNKNQEKIPLLGDLSGIIDKLRRYNNPQKYVEHFIKSIAYRCIIEDLKNTSGTLRYGTLSDYCVVSQIDGGFPLAGWYRRFLQQEEVSRSCFSPKKTPIFGISHGDEYYPLINVAHILASIFGETPNLVFPRSFKEVPIPSDSKFLENFYAEFSGFNEKPRFFNRILFLGDINPKIQFMIPFMKHYETNQTQIYEGFRIRESLRSFYKEFKGSSQKDVIVCGRIRNQKDQNNIQYCKDYGLNMTQVADYFQGFEDITKQLVDQACEAVDPERFRKIKDRLEFIKEEVKRSIS